MADHCALPLTADFVALLFQTKMLGLRDLLYLRESCRTLRDLVTGCMPAHVLYGLDSHHLRSHPNARQPGGKRRRHGTDTQDMVCMVLLSSSCQLTAAPC